VILRIELKYRSQGYGNLTLQALDEKLVHLNVKSFSLSVFVHNSDAVGLLEKMGY